MVVEEMYICSLQVLSLLNGKEHLNENNKWFHILGISKVSDFLMLNQLQKSLNEVVLK